MPGIQWTYSIPRPLVTSYNIPGIQWTYSIPRPLVTSYDMPGIQWTYSIPRPLVTSYDIPGIQWTYSTEGIFKYKVYNITTHLAQSGFISILNFSKHTVLGLIRGWGERGQPAATGEVIEVVTWLYCSVQLLQHGPGNLHTFRTDTRLKWQPQLYNKITSNFTTYL